MSDLKALKDKSTGMEHSGESIHRLYSDVIKDSGKREKTYK